MDNTKIQLKNVSKIYETEEIETHALIDIDLTIQAGDYISVSGPSGCGKSTLLSILGLLDSFNSGQYIIEGKDVSELSSDEAAEIRSQSIGFVFQSFNLIDELSVFENVALPLRYHPENFTKSEIEKKVNFSLDKVGLSSRVNHSPNQLSGGQQQRVAIARALVANPAILLVDEPTGNLDTKSGDQIMELIQKLNNDGTTICMVTHEQKYSEMAKIKLQLLDGKIKHQ